MTGTISENSFIKNINYIRKNKLCGNIRLWDEVLKYYFMFFFYLI